jgi:tetratricopeptide (TPR) repeat protein
MTQNNLGDTLVAQAKLLAGAERAARLAEAVGAYREALKVYTLDASPSDYAMTQNNLGNALGNQAKLLAGKERAARLAEAVGAYQEALKVYTESHYPDRYLSIRAAIQQLNRMKK